MGVTISCTKTGRTIDVGSGGFLRLRSKISELVGGAVGQPLQGACRGTHLR